MDRFAALTGRRYRLFDYAGDPEAERVIVVMGSGAETAARDGRGAAGARARRVGVVNVHLYRPFAVAQFMEALPRTRRARSPCSTAAKSRAAMGEPLYLDVVAALTEAARAGRLHADAAHHRRPLRLASKEFTPAMVKAVFDELARPLPRTTSRSASTTM